MVCKVDTRVYSGLGMPLLVLPCIRMLEVGVTSFSRGMLVVGVTSFLRDCRPGFVDTKSLRRRCVVCDVSFNRSCLVKVN
jgi:hypothetical protein